MILAIAIFGITALTGEVLGHGRLLDPPGRATAWRRGFKTPVNYNDDQMYCGGLTNQIKQGYKCGICGDPWQGPRHHEPPGRYATGTIVKHVEQPGSELEVHVQMTTNHMGWFEFRLCPNNNVNTPVTHACLDRYLLTRADGQGTRYNIKSKSERNVKLRLKLPPGLTCSQCVLQWKWHCANNWGIDPDTGRGCQGCGYQEEFYGCADISIGKHASSPPRSTQPPRRTTTPKAPVTPSKTPAPTTPPARCYPIGKWEFQPGMKEWCIKNCAVGRCPPDMCECRDEDVLVVDDFEAFTELAPEDDGQSMEENGENSFKVLRDTIKE